MLYVSITVSTSDKGQTGPRRSTVLPKASVNVIDKCSTSSPRLSCVYRDIDNIQLVILA